MLTGLGIPLGSGIIYTGLRSLNIKLGSRNDTLTIAGTNASGTVVNTGNAKDTVNVQEISGNTVVQGGAGSDTFVVSPMGPGKGLGLPLLLVGGSVGTNELDVTANLDFKLSDWNLTLSNGDSIALQSIPKAVLTGGSLDNTFDVSNWTGSATLNGGGGNDRVQSTNDANFTLADSGLTRSTGGSFNLSGIDEAILTGGIDGTTIDATGFTGKAFLYGGAGNNTLVAGSGDDYLAGGAGFNLLVGGAGNDVLVGGTGSGDTIKAGSGDTTIIGSKGGSDHLMAGSGNDRIFGQGGNNTIIGGTGQDILDTGTGGNNTVTGDATKNILIGRAPSDTLVNTASGPLSNGTLVYLYPNSSVPNPIPTYQAPLAAVLGGATLPVGPEEAGRWAEFAGSATGTGLSASPGQAIQPSIAAGTSGPYAAWADSRTGIFKSTSPSALLLGGCSWPAVPKVVGSAIARAKRCGQASQSMATATRSSPTRYLAQASIRATSTPPPTIRQPTAATAAGWHWARRKAAVA